ncbi:MAG: ABC transporter ATP-binding protein [Anaerolineales bacterium]|nr:ABC transporter ATP-binding protein [Anaerolineales bacterium]
MANEVLIRADGLRKTFGATHAVDDVSLEVAAGEIYGLVGPDGAGKTTLLRLLVGALLPSAGDVWLGQYHAVRQAELAREQIGYLAQRFALYEDLTVLENLQFFAEVRGLPSREWKPRSREILEFVGLAQFGDRRAGQLSGGMKQKLGLALALVNRPHILLLDEPTTGVDPVTRQDFWRLIIPLLNDGEMAVLVSTPYMDEAVRCTRVGFMRNGRIIREAPPAVLRDQLAGQIIEVAGHPQPLLVSVSEADPDVENVQRFGLRLHLRVAPGTADAVVKRLACCHSCGRRQP